MTTRYPSNYLNLNLYIRPFRNAFINNSMLKSWFETECRSKCVFKSQSLYFLLQSLWTRSPFVLNKMCFRNNANTSPHILLLNTQINRIIAMNQVIWFSEANARREWSSHNDYSSTSVVQKSGIHKKNAIACKYRFDEIKPAIQLVINAFPPSRRFAIHCPLGSSIQIRLLLSPLINYPSFNQYDKRK